MKTLTRPCDLFEVLALPSPKDNRLPLAAEMAVDVRLAPYLASSTRSLLWHAKAFKGMVRAGFRTGPLETIYREVLTEISQTSRDKDWGSVQEYTQDGLNKALAYVQMQGLSDLEILCPPDEQDDLLKGVATWAGLPVSRVDYLPPNMAVIAPKDRAFLGIALVRGGKDYLALCHNPSRGIAFACRF